MSTKKPITKSNPKTAASVKSEGRKVVLLDGHSLAFRAFFALPDTLVTSSGQITNAVYGFTAMLIKLWADERPDAVVVCFDKGAPQFRLDRYAEYKAGRAETPDTFRQQLPLIREVLGSLRIPMVELEGYEADDLLATLTKYFKQEKNEVVIVTGDRDILQLVGEGLSNPAIAEQLGITLRSTEKHVSSVFSKLGLPDTGNENRRVLAVLQLLRG